MMKTTQTIQPGSRGPGGQAGQCQKLSLPGGSQRERTAGGCCPTSHRTSRWEQPGCPAFLFYHHNVQLLAIAVLLGRTYS